jgi:dihydroflavonol-4-reductase
MARVLERAGEGRAFILAGEVVATRELVARVSALAGRRPPRLTIGVPVARALLGAATLAARLRGRRPPYDREHLASLDRHWAFDDSRARAELAWRPRPLAEGLPGTIEYLLALDGRGSPPAR